VHVHLSNIKYDKQKYINIVSNQEAYEALKSNKINSLIVSHKRIAQAAEHDSMRTVLVASNNYSVGHNIIKTVL